MAKKVVTVVQDAEKPVDKAVLAKAIVDLSAAAKRLAAGGLNRKAVVVLLSHDTGVGQGVIKAVLESMEHLQQTYLSR